jgi:hypothetical protein
MMPCPSFQFSPARLQLHEIKLKLNSRRLKMKTSLSTFSLGALCTLASFVAALIASHAVQAQQVTGIKATPTQLKPGEAAQIVVDFDVKDDRVNCGMRIYFGDGQQQDIKINQAEDVPIRVQHNYAKAGSYQVKAAPQNIGPIFKCLGKEVSTNVAVLAPAAAPVVTAPAPVQTPAVTQTTSVAPPTGKAMASDKPSCPAGFKLDAKSWNKKSGSYSCTAPKGAAMPAEKISCPNELAYFESKKSMKVGCKVE